MKETIVKSIEMSKHKGIFQVLLMLLSFILLLFTIHMIVVLVSEHTGFWQMSSTALLLVVPRKMDYYEFIKLRVGDKILLKTWDEIPKETAAARFDPFLKEEMRPLFGCEHEVIDMEHMDQLCAGVPDYNIRPENEPSVFYVHHTWIEEVIAKVDDNAGKDTRIKQPDHGSA
jgi:hypothetical protein